MHFRSVGYAGVIDNDCLVSPVIRFVYGRRQTAGRICSGEKDRVNSKFPENIIQRGGHESAGGILGYQDLSGSEFGIQFRHDSGAAQLQVHNKIPFISEKFYQLICVGNDNIFHTLVPLFGNFGVVFSDSLYETVGPILPFLHIHNNQRSDRGRFRPDTLFVPWR